MQLLGVPAKAATMTARYLTVTPAVTMRYSAVTAGVAVGYQFDEGLSWNSPSAAILKSLWLPVSPPPSTPF